MKNQFSLLKFPNFSRSLILSGAGIVFIIGFIFFIEQLLQKPTSYYDANAYLKLANQVNSEGIIAIKEPLRTFAYPWILSLAMKVSRGINLPEMLLIFFLQLGVYYIALLFVTRVFCEYSSRLAGSIYIALCLNIFTLPYTGVPLTDSLYTSLAIIFFAGIMKIEWEQRVQHLIPERWIFFGVLLVSLAITIRPASIWLIIPAIYCLVKLILQRNIKIINIISAVLLGAFPLYIQITLNTINYNAVTFFPVANLGASQIRWGIENIKYATWVGKNPGGNFYSSAALINVDPRDLNVWWYFHYPLDGCKLLFFKFIGAFDFDYLIVYPDHQPQIKWLASFFSFSILWGGILGVFTHLFTNKLIILGSRWMPLIILLSWGSVALFSALELRFTLSLLSYFILVSCVLFHSIISSKDNKLLAIMTFGWLFIMPLFYYVASFIRMQSLIMKNI